ncbi:MAG TPA: tripartite tricarboxylate transporter TctB family protein [Xanthobacteraceae bacterium]
MDIASRRITFDLPHALLVTAIAGWCLWYFLDARAASANVQNLVLIQPLAILVAILWITILRETIQVEPTAEAQEQRPARREQLDGPTALKVFGSMGLLGLYVASMSAIGLDLATFVYVLASLFLLGERRLAVLLAVPVVFTAIVVIAFDRLLATPLPLLLR